MLVSFLKVDALPQDRVSDTLKDKYHRLNEITGH